jgi:hypothetical protein
MLELSDYPRNGVYNHPVMSYLRGNVEMRLNLSFGNRHAVSMLGIAFMLAVSCVVSLPSVVFATAEEDAGAFEAISEPVQISELPPAPYIAGEATDQFRRKALSVISYIQHYNRKLAASEIEGIAQAIVQYSERYGIDYRLLTSLIAIESSFRRDAVSSSGAIGMGQLKPDTARWLGVLNPYDPVDNIAGTARFLSWLVKRYNGNLEYALSAYYQGPGHVDRNGITPVCMPYLEKVNRALGPLM